MTIPSAILTPNGLQPTPYQVNSLIEAIPLEPKGVYTVTRSYGRTKALLLDAHLTRLEESARLEGIPLTLNRPALREALCQLIAQTDYPDVRFRITVPRQQPDQLYLALEPFPLPSPSLRTNGVKVATLDLQRQNPRAKNSIWLESRKKAMKALGSEAYEGLLVDDAGAILEGASSNFYAVLGGSLYTAEEGILKGISRKALLEVAEGILPIHLAPILLSDLSEISQAFLTSSTRGVIPIVQINNQLIADGTPQALTLTLAQRYDDWTEAHLEPI